LALLARHEPEWREESRRLLHEELTVVAEFDVPLAAGASQRIAERARWPCIAK
jgi:hypothetical protein